MSSGLSEAQRAELKFLRGRVDAAQDRMLKVDRDRNAQLDLWYARERLEQFVESLRKQGVNI